MTQLQTAYRVWGHVKLAGALASGVAIFSMMLFIVADVVSRNYLGGSIAGSFEVAQNYFMPLSVFPALAYVYSSGILPKMDLARHRLRGGAHAVTTHLLVVLEIALFGILVHYTWGYALSGMDRGVSFPAGGSLYTLWPLFFLVPLGFAMVLVETLFVLAHNVLGDRVALSVAAPEAEARP